MFGLGLGEFLILLVVGIVVVGPKNLPTMMRTAGKWVGKLRRMSVDLRSQSGIDDLIRTEGLEREIQEIRSLSRVNVIDTLVTSTVAPSPMVPVTAPRPAVASVPRGLEPRHLVEAALREREYPLVGCDAYGALPDDVALYEPGDEASGGPGPGDPQ